MFRILHLSDLHARESTTWSTTPILIQAKKAILDQANKINIDLVAFTGDIAFSGKSEEYQIAQNWLEDLCLSSSGLNIQKEQLLFVPGNHDVDRKLIKPAGTAIEEQLHKASTQAEIANFYEDHDSKSILLKRHTAYFDFCASFLGLSTGVMDCWSRTFKAKGDGRIRVDGLNTSWLCCGDDDQRRLLVGQSQLTELIRIHSEAVKTHGEPDVRITLLHHPLADLMQFDEENTEAHLKQNTDILLRGHLHRPGSHDHMTNTGNFLELPAGALYGSHEWPNSFSILDISDDMQVLRVTPFLWESGRWIHNRNLFQTTDGIGQFQLKKKDETTTTVVSASPIRDRLAETDDKLAADDNGNGVPRISSSVARFLQIPNSQDQAIRQSQLEEAISRLHVDRKLVIHKEPGAKYEGFIACIIAELRRKGDGTLPHALHFRCAGVSTDKQFQDTIELMAVQSFTVFGKALRENGDSVLILDDLDFNPIPAPSATTIEGTIDAIHDFCPNVSVIRVTALPCPPEAAAIRVGRLDAADTRSYLNKAPRPVHLSSIVDYNRVHRGTGGLPIYLDDFIVALDVTNLDEALAQADAQMVTTADTLHESILKVIGELQHCTADDMKRTRALLWTLTILDQGESLGAIKRLDGQSPIWPRNANYLQSRGCLESATITSKLARVGRQQSFTDGDKILRIPRLVRDQVMSIMSREEREDIIRTVANLYFSNDWRVGIVRMRRRLAIGTEISTHQSGNELTILKHILKSPEVYFEKEPMVAFRLSLSYANQLKSKGFYGEAYEAAKDTLAIIDNMPSIYLKDDAYHITLLAASCARMVGERETCVSYLQSALPYVRASGVKATLSDALGTLSMALLSLKRNAEAKQAAEEVLELEPKNSSNWLQAKATLAEINMSRSNAVKYLRELATMAKNLGHFTVADNAMLEVVSDSDNTEEKLKMLNDIKSRRHLSYNFVRATIKRIDTLIDASRESELTGTDRDDLWFSYNLAYSQRMASIFNLCHQVYWKYLEATNGRQQLGDLYMHSSFVWRLRGESTEELTYTLKLQAEAKKHPAFAALASIVGYLTRRTDALSKSLGSS